MSSSTQPACSHAPRERARLLVLLPLLLGIGACAPLARFQSAGELAGQAVSTRVDSRAAAYFLERYLPGRTGDARLDSRLDAALADGGPEPRDRAGLRTLSEDLSTDVATMHFVEALYEQPDNRRMQDRYQRYVEEFTRSPRERVAADLAAYRDYRIVFVPGYAYRSNPANGADFRRQRALLTELGFDPVLIETDEYGNVEDNAVTVAAALRALAGRHDKLIVVSASKGGAETAAALSALRQDPAVASIEAWISVGGLLRGSPYADRFLSGIKRWFAKIMLRRQGQPPGILEELSTVERRPAFESLTLPSDVLMLQYVGAPLSGQVRDETRDRYKTMRRLGPNDGLTLLADELTERSVVVTEVGLDHYFRAPDIDIRTVALTYAVLEELERRKAAAGSEAERDASGAGAGPIS